MAEDALNARKGRREGTVVIDLRSPSEDTEPAPAPDTGSIGSIGS